MQVAASLKSECLSHWKIQGVVQINSNPFCIRRCKPWTSSTSVELTTVLEVPGNLEERGSHAVGPPRPIHYSRNTLFKNSRTAIWKSGRAPSFMNLKRILVCRSISSNSAGMTFLRKSQYTVPVRRGGQK